VAEATVFPRPFFSDRYDAGQQLGDALSKIPIDRPLIVLGLPRGGVPVASRVARALGAPLDVFVVRKLGVPRHEELGFGAIASGGACVLNTDMIGQLGLSAPTIDRVVAQEREELSRRELAFRDGRELPSLRGLAVVLVDDGAATGASMRAAVVALQQLGAREIIVALPVASREAVAMLEASADQCVCLFQPEPFYGVGLWYGDFSQTSDEEVRSLLADSNANGQSDDSAHAGARRGQ
jgi:predicted phosphoribosyltransferase